MAFARTLTLVLLMVTASLSGCAVFRSNNLQEIGNLPAPAAAAAKPTAGYSFKSYSDMGEKRPVHQNLLAAQEEELAKVLRESGYFASVDNAGGKDISISVDMVEKGNKAALIGAVITGLSLYTIPSWATVDMEIICKVVTADRKTRIYYLKDSATLVQWLPMMFVFPFKSFSEMGALRTNLYKNLIVKMQADGILPKAEQPAKTGHRAIPALVPAG